jgi:hypothetical protein
MLRRFLILVVLTLGGCSPRGPEIYDACDTTDVSCTTAGCCELSTCTPVRGTATAAVCTNACASHDDCQRDSAGVRGVCLAFGATSGICVQACETDSTCPTAFTCQAVDVYAVCLP